MEKTVINNKGFIVERSVLVDKNNIYCYKLREGEQLVDRYTNVDLVNPCWDGSTWVEGATEEEIQASKEENKAEDNIQATEEQQLLSTVLLENAEIKEQLKEQQELCSNLMLQIAELREEKVNV